MLTYIIEKVVALSGAITICEMDDSVLLLTDKYGFSCRTNENEVVMSVPDELGSGYFKYFFIGNDLTVGITKLKLNRPISMHYENYDNQFETTYCLNGHIGYAETGIIETGLRKNEYGVYLKQQSRGMIMYPSGEEICSAAIIASGKLLDMLPLYDDCTSAKEANHRNLIHQLMSPHKSDLPLHNMFLQLCKNNMEDGLQTLIREGIAKTIVATMWQNCVMAPLSGKVNCGFDEYERKALHHAALILEQNYRAPPTISELSKMAGINEYRLKVGFKAMYGKTVHEYTHGVRMKTAYTLLDDDSLNISHIAYMVGYINVSHFSNAFKREYGLNPSDLRNGA